MAIATTDELVATMQRRLNRWQAQKADLLADSRAGSSARALLDIAEKVTYLDGKIDATLDYLDDLNVEAGGSSL